MFPHSIFEKSDYNNILSRLSNLTAASTPAWGKMNVGQMLAHLNLPLEVSLGKRSIKNKPGFLMRLFLKPFILSKKPWKPGLPTGKDFLVTDPKDFEQEKSRLIENLKEAHQRGESGNWGNHPALGKLKPAEHGWLTWKHVDHHLRQFKV